MFSAIRKRISPTTAVAFMALVFAMTGGAFAATGSGGSPAKAGASATHATLVASTAKAKPKPKAKAGPRGPAGAKGAAGATGPSGAVGPAGATGPQGPAGANGANGTNGEKGTNGTNGEKGAKGAAGSPWVAGGTLPGKSTETGVWSYGEIAAPVEELHVPISFPIPLSAELDGNHVHYINAAGKELNVHDEEVASTACTGTAAAPTAEEGNLCVYSVRFPSEPAGLDDNFVQRAAGAPGEPGASTAGAVLLLYNPQAETYAVGTWAVTAE